MRLRVKPSKGSILAVLMLLCVVTSFLGPRAAVVLRRPAQVAFSPLGDLGAYLGLSVKNTVNELTSDEIPQDEAQRLRQANQELQGQVDNLQATVMELRQQQAKIQKLDQLLFGPVDDIPYELIPGRVIGFDSMMYGQTRVINAPGALSGSPVTTRKLLTDRSKAMPQTLRAVALPPKMEQMASAVLVGKLMETSAFTARLQLVIDRGFTVRAKILRVFDAKNPREINDGTKRRKMTQADDPLVFVPEAKGDGVGGLTVSNVKEDDNVQKGDFLVTCNDDPLLRAQVRIGQVVAVTSDPRQAGFVNIKVEPAADLDSLREVFVVVPLEKKDASGKP